MVEEKKCSSSTQKLELLLVVSNLGFIDTGNPDNLIYSMQFIEPTEWEELLILGGNSYLGCQIYKRNGLQQPSRFQLLVSLKFEDTDNHNCCEVKGKYLFAMQ
jgi:hypothetical protein